MKHSSVQMLNTKHQTVTVFGNEVITEDSLAVRLLPKLKEVFPEVYFEHKDPTEEIRPLSDPWIILDVAVGISEVVVLTDLSKLEQTTGLSVHDYDVFLDLKVKQKLGRLPDIRLVLIPSDMSPLKALDRVLVLLKEIL